ncbi:LysR family transcriptional regulator [Ruegeria sp. EL01]|jgi:DNA-binding transcriptional LysR family regulator|uniref:LysR family transcriptional regulator n=1 Tax=Ruegeria sp. EL01 TaxID=2107578 RepID=UPI000EA80BCC|nr:LysR family transcriptional regulator [Ruegeria sp. EL01]
MQGHDWNDLKYLLALHREGKLTQAGRTLGVSETTVARRIKTLEQSLGTTLFLRSASGRYEPTDAALHILTHAETIEASNAALREVSGESANGASGSVRISSVPIIVNRLLVPGLAALERLHPSLTVELVPTSFNLDLSKREADLAVRFARPSEGGLRTKAQKLGELSFAAYAASFISPDQHAELRWITYDEAHLDLPQARWLESAAKSSGLRANLKVVDAETGMQAVAEGIGKALLPRAIAAGDARLREVEQEGDAKYPTREVWLLSHVDQTSRLSIKAVKAWLSSLDWV